MMPPQTSITEFPFFTFLFADLHAHLMAIPFDVAILGVGLALVLATDEGDAEPRASDRLTSWLGVAVLGLLVGALRPINSWDYPPFLLIGVVVIFIGERAEERTSGLAGDAQKGDCEGGGPGGAIDRVLLPVLAELPPVLQGLPRLRRRRRPSTSTWRISACSSSPRARWSSPMGWRFFRRRPMRRVAVLHPRPRRARWR